MPWSPIQVAVVHDDFLARLGLASLLSDCEDMVVRQLEPIDASLSRFDVVVADPRSGTDILGLSQDRPGVWPKVAIVAASMKEWPARVSLERGAAAYVIPGGRGDDIIHAVRTLHQGGFHVSADVAANLAESLSGRRLTAREQEVLTLVTEGLCNKLIASRLAISVATVKTHLRTAYDKLSVRSRTQAAATVQRHGLLHQPGWPSRDDEHALDATLRSLQQALHV